MMDYDELYRLISLAELTRDNLQGASRLWIPVRDMRPLCHVLNELAGWDSSAYRTDLPQVLGFSPTTINKFLKRDGSVRLPEARALANRTVSYLKSLDQASDDEDEDADLMPVPAPTIVRFEAMEWVSIPQTRDNKAKIAEVTRILEDLVKCVATSNTLAAEPVLSDMERQQLIAILKVALKILESPMVEKGLLLQLRQKLQKAAVGTAEKKVQEGIGMLADKATWIISELIRLWF